jgi:hypothetical protein
LSPISVSALDIQVTKPQRNFPLGCPPELLANTTQIKEMIYCAFDAASTHLYKPGLKLHMQNVLRYGGTPEEILAILEIATLLSLHTLEVATPILAQEIARRS